MHISEDDMHRNSMIGNVPNMETKAIDPSERKLSMMIQV